MEQVANSIVMDPLQDKGTAPSTDVGTGQQATVLNVEVIQIDPKDPAFRKLDRKWLTQIPIIGRLFGKGTYVKIDS